MARSTRLRRRTGVIVTALATAGMLALSGCSGSGTSAESSDDVTLRFAYWGGDLRTEMTDKVIDAFEAKNPHITVKGETTDFTGYFDKLATQVAANDAPDIIQMPDSFFNEYVGRGALLDLSDLNIDHDDIDDSVWNTGVIDEKLYGVPSGVNTTAIVANPALFKKAGIALPDDTTWTWDDYQSLAQELSNKLGDGYYGSQSLGLDQNNLAIWLRQNDASLFTDSGKIGFTAKDAAPFFTMIKEMSESGATPTAEQTTEDAGATLEQSGSATGKYAMGLWASNQLTNLDQVSSSKLKLLRLPTETGKASDGEFTISGGWYTSYARTKHPEEVAKFMDFIVNSPEAGKILLTERGAPANSVLRQNLLEETSLADSDKQSIEFLNSLQKVAMDPPPAVPPVGAGGFQDILRRYVSEVLFGRQTPKEAAQSLIDEAKTNIK